MKLCIVPAINNEPVVTSMSRSQENVCMDYNVGIKVSTARFTDMKMK